MNNKHMRHIYREDLDAQAERSLNTAIRNFRLAMSSYNYPHCDLGEVERLVRKLEAQMKAREQP